MNREAREPHGDVGRSFVIAREVLLLMPRTLYGCAEDQEEVALVVASRRAKH
jgi:hypothetical protein